MGLTRIRAEQISDIDYKQAVRVIQRTNIELSGGAPSSVDGVGLSTNDRILVTGQDSGAQNGIYRVQTLGAGSNGTWVRTSDANSDGEIEAGMIIMVTEGEVYKDTQWKLTTNNPIVIGTTPLTFVLNAVSVVGGSTTQIQYNQGGVLEGSANLTWAGSELYVNGAANVTGNVTGGNIIATGIIQGSTIDSVNADLAERYITDAEYPPGTVVVFGGDQEVTQSTKYADPCIAGVISTAPAYTMNVDSPGQAVALQGRVPCRVIGKICKGDLVTSSDRPGTATRLDPQDWVPGSVIGKSLDNYDNLEEGTIEVVVGRV